MLSYEIGIITILILVVRFFNKSNLENFSIFIRNFFYLKYLVLIIFFIIILGETRRIPFDFVERESELIAGFNVEFSSVYFSIFFIYEYGIILFFRILIRIIFSTFFLIFIIIFIFIHIRTSFPRIRYDQIIKLIWKFIYILIFSFIILLKIFLMKLIFKILNLMCLKHFYFKS